MGKLSEGSEENEAEGSRKEEKRQEARDLSSHLARYDGAIFLQLIYLRWATMTEFWVVDLRFLFRGKEEDSRLGKARSRDKKEGAQKQQNDL
ncbi:hypothetical protein ACFX13_037608 [Malus domestica]